MNDNQSECVLALYRARPNCEDSLRQLLATHVPMLRRESFATTRPVVLLQSKKDGTYLEIFEWKSGRSIDEAHANPVVKEYWEKFDEVSEFRKLGDLAEATDLFPSFCPIDDVIVE